MEPVSRFWCLMVLRKYTTMRPLTLLLLLAVTFAHTSAQSTPQTDPNISLKVSIATDQREFHIGERIPLQLAFSSSAKDRYQINMAQYDRSGRSRSIADIHWQYGRDNELQVSDSRTVDNHA